MKPTLNVRIACFLAALTGFSIVHSESTPPFDGWKAATTNHFRFIYEDAFRPQAEEFALIADTTWNVISQNYSTPPEMTDVILTGRTDIINAYAEGLSYFMGFYTNPPMSPEFGYRDDWAKIFFTHELVHIANFSFEDRTSTVADIFGPFWNLVSVAGTPPWAMEGATTVLETELTNGGRGRSPFFELFYKAPTLENAFLHFNEIGLEKTPPRGQIYIMGYLLMRSIADRWGTGALADIERNRSGGRNFNDSVRLVTGYTPEQIFQDVRIALSKKYAPERGIPEGKTITQRIENTDYYRPALVSDTGIVTIRDVKGKDRAAVRFNPSDPGDTLLFEGNFADELSLTASEDGKIIAALVSEQLDKMPGYTVHTDLYTWTGTQGLVQLTEGESLFQPALSRSGNRLVAVELSGMKYRLVEVDPSTGKRTVLLESPSESYIQPALSSDGKRLAFLSLDGNRAVLATAPMPQYEFAYPIPQATISKEANMSGAVADIAYPSWTKDGRLLFASNARGRLEVWEMRGGKSEPVVSDPVGAFWADTTTEGTIYASYAGTGFVLKIKPSDEWGKVPAFAGPSTPGEIVKLGHLASDYPLFTPFPPKESDQPNEFLSRKENIRTTTAETVLQNEKPFYNLPRLQLWLPTVGYLALPDESGAFGFGGFAAFTGYPLQNGSQGNMIVAGGNWYPTLGQTDAFLFSSFPVNTGLLTLYGGRVLDQDTGNTRFSETSTGLVSFSFPIFKNSFFRDRLDMALVSGLEFIAQRTADSPFSAASEIPYRNGITAKATVDTYYRKMATGQFAYILKTDFSVLLSSFPGITKKQYVSGEFSAALSGGSNTMMGEAGVRTRLFDLDEEAPIPGTLVKPKAGNLDCSFPGRSIVHASLVVPGDLNSRLFLEKLISFGKDSAPAPVIDPYWYAGAELEAEAGRSRISLGVVNRFKKTEAFEPINGTKIFLIFRLDALQASRP